MLYGAPLAAQLKAEVVDSLQRLSDAGAPQPTLATVSAGKTSAADAYERAIRRSLLAVGIEHVAIELSPTIGTSKLISQIEELNANPLITGVLFLAPLPAHLPVDIFCDHLSPVKDVDGITPENAGRLHLGLPSLQPSTPTGGVALLDYYAIPIAGRNCVVVGRSNVVGRPMASLLTHRNGTVTICHRQTTDLAKHLQTADIIAVAAGSPGLINADHVKRGVIVLDFGINFSNGAMVGDVDFASLLGVAGGVTPVPGGTGPVTSMILAQNTIAAGFAALRGDLDAVWMVDKSKSLQL